MTPHSHPAAPHRDALAAGRYLRLGSEHGTYDAPAPDIREVAAPAVDRWLAADGVRLVHDAARLLTAGTPYRPDPAIHVLARAVLAGPAPARGAALAALPEALPSAAHLFKFLRFVRGRTPWTGALREAIAAWYARRTPLALAEAFVLTPADGAWNHREALLLARPQPPSDAHEALFAWLAEGRFGAPGADDRALALVADFARLHTTGSPAVVLALLQRWPQLRAALPPAWYRDADVAEHLAATLPAEALMPWIGRLAAHGALAAGSPVAAAVARRLEAPAAAPPFAVLEAWAAVRFAHARGLSPHPALPERLEALFHARLAAMRPTAGPLAIAVDPSASTAVDGLPACPGLDPRTAIAALALLAVHASARPTTWVYGRGLEPLDLAPGDELRTVLRRLDAVRGGAVDGAAPIEAAYADGAAVSGFLVLAGTRPASRALAPDAVLARYNEATGSLAGWTGVSLGHARISPQPPEAAEALEIHGWDASVPQVLADALAGAGR